MRLLYSGLRWLGAGLLILLAVLLSAARLLTPHIADYHGRIEQRVGELIGQRVDIGAIRAAWHGFGPRLRLNDIDLIDSGTGRPLLHFAHGEVGINLLTSLLRGGWYVDRLTVSGVRLSVIRGADGGLTVAGIEVPAVQPGAGATDADQLLRWLLAQGRLAVDHAAVSWIDRSRAGSELQFSDVSLEMRNAGTRHQLTGFARLPALIGQRFSFAIDVQGDLLVAQGWDARAYVEGIGLHLPEVLQGMGIAGLSLERGDAGASVWGTWERGRMTRLEGVLSAFDLGLVRAQAGVAPAAAPRLIVDVVTGRFAWRRRDDGWRLDVNDFTFARQGRRWPASDFGLQYVRGTGADAGSLRLHAGYLDLNDTARLLALSDLPSARETELLQQLDPRGRLYDLDLAFAGGVGSGPYAVRTRFENLATAPWEKVPGVQGLDGALAADEHGGRVALDTSGAQLLFPRLFRGPLPVSALRGQLQWTRDADGWRVAAPELTLHNEDLDLQAWGGLELPAGGTPTLALFGAFQAATAEHTSRYLPVDIMPESAVHWLDRAITGGTVPRGELLFYGPLAAFPFDHGEGRFLVDFDVQDGVLDYAADWPLLDQIEANVVFDGRGMAIHAADGRSLSSTLTTADVRIADLRGHPAVLEVEGKIQGPTQDALRYLRESPLREKFGAYVAGLEASGDSRLDLKLALPLNDAAATQVDGRLQFDDSRLATTGGGFDMAHIRGELRFTESGLSARGIEADVLGLPARIDVVPEDDEPGTRIAATGQAGVAALERWIPAGLRDRLQGTFPWTAELRIPAHAAAAALRVGADLTAAAIDLPPPLGKAAGDALAVEVTATVPHVPVQPLRLQWGDALSGILELDEDMAPRRGELRVGGGAAVLPPEPGLRIAGRLERLAYADWAAVYAGLAPAAGAAGGPQVGAVDLSAATADFHGHEFHQAHIAAARKSPGWELQVDSQELQGRIVIPEDPHLAWTMDLDHLYVVPPAESGDEGATVTTDPRELPALHIMSRRFKYNAIDFGSLDLAASRQDDGLHLDRLLLSSDHMRIDARGDWSVAADAAQSSAFNIKFDSGDFGAALTQLGYADTLDAGKGHFDIKARWEGAPTDFALEKLDGSMRMTVSDGRLLEVEPGAGRIFGLLSLQALPRRLSLDFSDFFRKGFSFDRIEGNFAVKDGSAATRDLTMTGPAAKIAVNGKIDLAARTYDQTVVVTPSVASGLPVAGAVAGGPAVGAVILLMEKMFKPNIERMTRVTYRVTGSWSDPVIEREQDAPRSDKR
jgi:uncharacterized protein (TIGR02099 family)